MNNQVAQAVAQPLPRLKTVRLTTGQIVDHVMEMMKLGAKLVIDESGDQPQYFVDNPMALKFYMRLEIYSVVVAAIKPHCRKVVTGKARAEWEWVK